MAHPTHLHQSTRLFLYPFGTINYDNNAIYGRKGTESIFRKILVPRGV